MDYQKKVLLMKQTAEGYSLNDKPVSGILRIEQELGVHTLYLSLINIAPVRQGEYVLYVADSTGQLLPFTLGSCPSTFNTVLNFSPDLSRGFTAGLCYENDGVPLLFAFSKSADSEIDLTSFKCLIASRAYKTRKAEKSVETMVSKETVQHQKETLYDDEAVATENYYTLDDDINQKLEILEKEDGRLQSQNGELNNPSEKETGKIQENAFGYALETGTDFGEKYSEDNPYYLHAKKELDELFSKFPVDLGLSKLFPDSRFVRINYSPDKYYVVGVIKEEKKEKYICYGVPSPYSDKAPKELEGFCSFIPLSIFEMKGDGYFMMFQDAVTGECIKKSTN